MKKKEIGIIIAILVIALGMIFVTNFMRSNNAETNSNIAPSEQPEGQWVAIVHRNQVVQWFDSGVDALYTVDGDYGELNVEVQDGRWHVSEVECPNHTCEGMGWDDGSNITPILCIPNNVAIVTEEWVSGYINE